jgi:hypothetical protein
MHVSKTRKNRIQALDFCVISSPYLPTARRSARRAGRPASIIFFCAAGMS